MKFQNQSQSKLDVSSLDVVYTGTIAEDEQAKLFNIISKDMYSDSIGSMIRELTSNAEDAHHARGRKANDPDYVNNTPIIVSLVMNDVGQSILSIQDRGLGMNVDIIKNVYSRWLKSTKTKDNNALGQWGLGSKAPLAYRTEYTVHTVADQDGKRYEWIYLVGQGATAPSVARLHVAEVESDQDTGTRVEVEIKHEDVAPLVEKMATQLAYFTNVVYVGAVIEHLNKYHLNVHETFFYKQNVANEMHLCMGPVYYPIKTQAVGRAIDRILRDYPELYEHCLGHVNELLKIPIALRFDIGELVVTPNREELQYVTLANGDSTELTVAKRIVQALYALRDVLKAESIRYTNVFEYYFTLDKLARERAKKEQNLTTYRANNSQKTTEFKLGKGSITITGEKGYIEMLAPAHILVPEDEDFPLLTMTSISHLLRSDGYGYVSGSTPTMRKQDHPNSLMDAYVSSLQDRSMRTSVHCIKPRVAQLKTGKSKLVLAWKYSSYPDTLTLHKFADYVLDMQSSRAFKSQLLAYYRKDIMPYHTQRGKTQLTRLSEIPPNSYNNLEDVALFRKKWIKYIKYIKKLLLGLMPLAEDVKTTPEFTAWAVSRGASDNSSSVITSKDEFVTYNLKFLNRGDQKVASTTEELSKIPLVIVGPTKKVRAVDDFRTFLLARLHRSTAKHFMSERVRFITTAPTHVKKLINFPNVMLIQDFIKKNQAVLAQAVTRKLLGDLVKKRWVNYTQSRVLSIISSKYKEYINFVDSHQVTYNSYEYKDESLIIAASEFAIKKGWVIQDWLDKYHYIMEVVDHVAILEYCKRDNNEDVSTSLHHEVNGKNLVPRLPILVAQTILHSGKKFALELDDQFYCPEYMAFLSTGNPGQYLEDFQKELILMATAREEYLIEIRTAKKEPVTKHSYEYHRKSGVYSNSLQRLPLIQSL